MAVRARPGRLRPAVAFWLVGFMLALLLFASAAPSPLYVVYQQQWGFSSLTLTSVFAVYALALLAALVLGGSLSDQIGRRPVLAGSLAAELVAMILFAAARDVGWLFAARTVQGAATGLATGALSAALIDLAPPGRRPLGALIGSSAPIAGLAAGALFTGILVEYAPAPTRLVFWLLAAAFSLLIVAVAFVAETVPAERRSRATVRPRVGVPHEARGAFVAAAPCLVALWALGGLYLSLGPSLTLHLLHTKSHVVAGLVIVALNAAGATASVVFRTADARRAMIGGSVAVIAGVSMTLAALGSASTVLLLTGSLVTGLGFGPAFSGAFRSITAAAPPDRRAELIAAVYVLSYLAFSLPAIAAGIAVPEIGLSTTADIYGGGVIGLTAMAMVAFAVRPRAGVEPAAETAPSDWRGV